jgi:hypothetical protein
MNETTMTFRPGDVVRYEPENRWCHDGYAIAEKRRDGQVILVDTYWNSGASLGTVEPLVYEHLFNLADYDVQPAHVWETFAPADRQYIPKHSGYQTVHLVRKGATPDLATRISNAQDRVDEAESALRSAERTLAWRRRELADLEAQAAS